jgi:hypothetical protein
MVHQEVSLAPPDFSYLTNRFRWAYIAAQERLHGIVEDVMRLELRYRSDIDLSQTCNAS